MKSPQSLGIEYAKWTSERILLAEAWEQGLLLACLLFPAYVHLSSAPTADMPEDRSLLGLLNGL